MESLLEHRAMLYSLAASAFAVFSLAWGASDDVIKQFELVILPDEVRMSHSLCPSKRKLTRMRFRDFREVSELVLIFPPFQLRLLLVKYVAADLVGCYALDRSLNFLLGDMF